ncbi:MAG: hypothetical protein JW841_18145 [Deltaproteobacteria bacterium]|nr:hypothetical protein [Deltaproteobacteria bacterium]
MPCIRLETTETLTKEQQESLCAQLSKLCAETIGKSENYQMAIVRDGVTIFRAGKPGPAAFIEVRSIGGLTAEVNHELSEKLCSLLQKTLNINGERVSIIMMNIEGKNWGHNSTTYAGC